MKNKRGITLIALVVTIIVLIILAGITINMVVGDNGILTKAQEARFKTELAKVDEEFKLYTTNKYLEDNKFELGTLNAGKNLLTYNTKPEDEVGNIKTILSDSEEKYVDCFEVIKGELIYSSQNERELRWALEIGMKINPYLIVDGVLLSADTNLMLMDEATGTIVVPESVTAIGQGTFANVKGMKRIIIPSTVKEIRQDAFNGNTTLEEIIILTDGTEGLKVIGNGAFNGCSNLKTIQMPDTVEYIGQQAFASCETLNDLKISSNVKNLRMSTFYNCKNLNEIEIPEGIKTIEGYCFQGCEKLKKVILPTSIETISKDAFYADMIDKIEISSNNENFVYENGILLGDNRKQMCIITTESIQNDTFTIPNGVEELGNGAIKEFKQIQKVIIPASVNYMFIDFFPDTITQVEVDENNPNFTSIDGYILNKDGTKLYMCFLKTETITLKEGITTIASSAFAKCTNIQTLNMPSTLETLEGSAMARYMEFKKSKFRKKCKKDRWCI